MALLLAGLLAAGFALRFLFARQLSRALRIGAIGIACIALAFVLGRSRSVHSSHAENRQRPSGIQDGNAAENALFG